MEKKYFWIAFFFIMSIGIFLRVYNFTPWLHFELDQARDMILVNTAVENGAGELPLLGPRAAGTVLRLGPAFYYIQYLGAKIFGSTPQGVAYPILIFSILSIPVFYLFIRRYFNKGISLALMALFACSLFLVSYSRFAWNPNMLPFFYIAFFYFLLRSVDANDKNNKWWLVIASALLAVLIQFHFLALITAPLIGVIFLLIKRPKIKAGFWIASIGIFLFLNIPMIVNEAKTGGENSKQFLSAVFDKSDKTEKTFIEKISQNYKQHAIGYWIILSGGQKADFIDIVRSEEKMVGYEIQCDYDCRKNIGEGLVAFALFTLSIVAFFLAIKRERLARRKDFLTLNALWFGIAFIVFIPLSFDLSPRFFLVSAAIPFVFLGLLLERVEMKIGSRKNLLIILAILIFAISNLAFNGSFFKQLNLAKDQNVQIGNDKILKQKTRITLIQENEIVDLMSEVHAKNGNPILFDAQSEFSRALAFLLDKKSVPRDGIEQANIYRNANYFLIIRTQSDKSYLEKYEKKFLVKSKKEIGTLTIYYLKQKNEYVSKENVSREKLEREITNFDPEKEAKRYTWQEIFSK